MKKTLRTKDLVKMFPELFAEIEELVLEELSESGVQIAPKIRERIAHNIAFMTTARYYEYSQKN